MNRPLAWRRVETKPHNLDATDYAASIFAARRPTLGRWLLFCLLPAPALVVGLLLLTARIEGAASVDNLLRQPAFAAAVGFVLVGWPAWQLAAPWGAGRWLARMDKAVGPRTVRTTSDGLEVQGLGLWRLPWSAVLAVEAGPERIILEVGRGKAVAQRLVVPARAFASAAEADAFARECRMRVA